MVSVLAKHAEELLWNDDVGNLGETSFGMLKLGETSFGLLKLGD